MPDQNDKEAIGSPDELGFDFYDKLLGLAKKLATETKKDRGHFQNRDRPGDWHLENDGSVTISYVPNGFFEYQSDRLSTFVTSDKLTPAQKAEFLNVFNSITNNNITLETLDKDTLKAAISRQFPDQSVSDLGSLILEVRDKLSGKNPLKSDNSFADTSNFETYHSEHIFRNPKDKDNSNSIVVIVDTVKDDGGKIFTHTKAVLAANRDVNMTVDTSGDNDFKFNSIIKENRNPDGSIDREERYSDNDGLKGVKKTHEQPNGHMTGTDDFVDGEGKKHHSDGVDGIWTEKLPEGKKDEADLKKNAFPVLPMYATAAAMEAAAPVREFGDGNGLLNEVPIHASIKNGFFISSSRQDFVGFEGKGGKIV